MKFDELPTFLDLKQRILHVTESLNRGGAEVLLVGSVNALPDEFENVVVYLQEPSTLKPALNNVSAVYCLHYKGKKDLVPAALRLSKIIQKHKIKLVHSHLYWPTIIARLAVSKKVPLIFSVHSTITDDAFKPNILSKYLEKLTYSKRQTGVFVSKTALDDYRQHIKATGENVVLYNFVKNEFYAEDAEWKQASSPNQLKLVTVGNLRPQKNHLFLIECVRLLADDGVTLDIYGAGHFRSALELYIAENNINNVKLMGSHPHPERVLKHYDIFVYASRYEGFCIAMAEAMAVGLPCVVPGLKALKEVSGEGQIYYAPEDREAFLKIMRDLNSKPESLINYSTAAKRKALEYRCEKYVNELAALYYQTLKL
ncbi:glycosyltransferase [Pontibacter toksunensis]|uniref:Glycosyltransferase n=1 Tax=Pontibacter toksunensis TaxID=1332631 RepID=A0ABW6BWE0_9BACT